MTSKQLVQLLLRFSVALSMLGSLAGRFGLLARGGNMDSFLQYTGSLMPWLPSSFVGVAGWAATILELVFSICLVFGIKLRWTAVMTGCLISTFILATLTSKGLGPVLDHGALNAAAAAFAIAFMGRGKLEVRS